ncbi:MAG TPA: hypothetical protein VNK41_08935 [Vicinamibacterales bacterium]|nr:hypothetical protein [Vicinamibacterales bacterium]
MVRRFLVWAACVSAAMMTASQADAQIRRVSRGSEVGENYHVEASVGLWRPSTDIVVKSESLGIQGTEIDAVEDLGFQDKSIPQFKVTLRPTRRFKLRFGYTPISYTAESTLRRNIIFNGQLYNVGLPVNTDFKWNMWRAGLQFDVVAVERGFLGFIIEGNFTDFRVNLTNPLTSEFTDVKAPIPAIGGIGRVYVTDHFAITGEMTGLSLTIDEDKGSHFDFDVNGTYYFNRYIGAQFGYRRMSVHYEVDLDSGDMKLSGLYFGASARF